jgi:hypothetical protein
LIFWGYSNAGVRAGSERKAPEPSGVGLAGVPQEGCLYSSRPHSRKGRKGSKERKEKTGGAGLTTPPCGDRGTKFYAQDEFAVRFLAGHKKVGHKKVPKKGVDTGLDSE